MLLTSGSLMTSKVRSKSKFDFGFYIYTIYTICRALEPYEMEIRRYNVMDRVWDTSKYHPKPSVSIFKVKVTQGHEVKEWSNWKFWVSTAWYMFLGSGFSSGTRKMTVKHFLNGPNRTNFENRENTEIARDSVKNSLLSTFKTPKLGHFQDIYLKFCTHMHLTGFFHIYCGFLKIPKNLHFWK